MYIFIYYYSTVQYNYSYRLTVFSKAIFQYFTFDLQVNLY